MNARNSAGEIVWFAVWPPTLMTRVCFTLHFTLQAVCAAKHTA